MTCKVLITGGHLTPALATIDSLLKLGAEIVFVGKPSNKQRNDDEQEMIKREISFISLKTGKFHRHSFLRAFFSLLIVPSAILSALMILYKTKPNVVLSFGGYLSVPVILAAWILRIPSVTHEQTRGAGLANKINSLFVIQVGLAFEDSKVFFPKSKTIVLGNPIRLSIVNNKNNGSFESILPYIYIVGGHQGAGVINKIIFSLISKLKDKINIVHSIGVSEKLNNDWQTAQEIMKLYPDNYMAKRYFGESEIGQVMEKSTLIISRSGANTCTEIAHLNKPSILIPLPTGQSNEQLTNAKLLEKLRLGVIVLQEDLGVDTLFDRIVYVMDNLNKFSADSQDIEKYFPLDAADKLAKLVLSLCKK